MTEAQITLPSALNGVIYAPGHVLIFREGAVMVWRLGEHSGEHPVPVWGLVCDGDPIDFVAWALHRTGNWVLADGWTYGQAVAEPMFRQHVKSMVKVLEAS